MSRESDTAESPEPKAGSDTNASTTPLVSTIGERCRVCYQCVRECPAKAIRIADWQAEVHPRALHRLRRLRSRCARQSAKRVVSAVEDVEALLRRPRPRGRHASRRASRPSSSTSTTRRSSARCARWASTPVHEVAFGAELVAREYRRLVATDSERVWIATTCPAVVGYVERYYPDLTPALAPIVSPMVATARLLRRLHGADLQDRLHRPLHRQEARDGRTARRGRRGPDVRRSAPDGRCARSRPARGRGCEFDPPLSRRRRPVPDQRRHAAGGGDPGRPRDRARDGRRGAGRVRPGASRRPSRA